VIERGERLRHFGIRNGTAALSGCAAGNVNPVKDDPRVDRLREIGVGVEFLG